MIKYSKFEEMSFYVEKETELEGIYEI